MHQHKWLFTVVLTFVILFSIANNASAQNWQLTADRLFRQYARDTSPGLAMVVVKDGEVIYQKGYGMANLRYGVEIDPETTIFRTASNSKQFTAFCILLLNDEGLLSLDDDVRDYIPEVPDFGETITLRHLIYHTSGLRDYLSLGAMKGLYLMNDLIYKEHGLEWIEQQQDLNFSPGEQFMYSNSGYLLLGEIVARVSGQTLAEFAKERIFDPLGMTNTRFIDNYQVIIENYADAYLSGPDGKTWHSPIGYSSVGAAGLASTAIDLAKWDENFYNPIVGNETIIEMMHQRVRLNDGSESPMSMGLIVEEAPGIKVVYHGGDLVGFHCQTMRFPDEHFSIIFNSNTFDLNSGVLATRAIAIRNAYLSNPDTSVSDFELHEASYNPGTVLAGFMHPDLELLPYFNPQKPKVKTQTALRSQAKPQLTLPQVRRYLGRYYSEELDVFYSVELNDDGELWIIAPRLLPYITHINQIETDGSFVSPDFSELAGAPSMWGRFTSDESNQVDGMLLSTVRITDLKLIKVTTPPFD